MANVYNYVTDRIVAELEKGNIPWKKNWKGQQAINYLTRKPYHGINTLLLPLPGEYLTFKQCSDLKGTVKKGEKSSMIVFYKWYEKENKDTGKMESYPVLNYYNVFHLSQTEGIDSKLEPFTIENNHNTITEAEQIISEYVTREQINYNIIIGSDRAYFQPLTDMVVMPDIKQFDCAENYYSTAFHELTHSTGTHNRLKRHDSMKSHKFGSKDYSREELVAEIGSCYLNNNVGIDNSSVFQNNVAYIQNWSKAIKDDPRMITIAAGQAQKAVNYILNIKDTEKTETV